MHISYKRIISSFLIMAMIFTNLSPSFRTYANTEYDTVIQEESMELEDMELINDLESQDSSQDGIALSGDLQENKLQEVYDSLTKAIVATPAVAILKEEIAFEGLATESVEPGSVVNLMEGVEANTRNLNLDLGVIPVEVRDASGQVFPIASDGEHMTFTVPEGTKVGSSFTVAYLAVADKDAVEVINQVASEVEGTVEEESKKAAFTNQVNEAIDLASQNVMISSGEELAMESSLKDAVKEAKKAVITPQTSTPSETEATVFSAFRSVGSMPVASRTRQLITLQGLPSGNVTFKHYSGSPTGPNPTNPETKYTNISQVGSVAFNGGNLPAPVNNAYIELIAPTKHLARNTANEVTGLNMLTGNYITRVEKEIKMINGEEHIVLRGYYSRLLSSTDAVIPYTVRFKEDRSVPEGYKLPVEANLRVVGENDIWKTSDTVKYGAKYDPQDFYIYANLNVVSTFSNDSNVQTGVITGVYGGEPDPTRQFVNPATAVNAPMKFKLRTTEGGDAYSSADRIKQRLIQTVELYVDIPTYQTAPTSSDAGATRLAVFEEASNPDWQVMARDAQGRPTKVKLVVNATVTPEEAARRGIDAGRVLQGKDLNLKYPNLMVNHFNQNQDSALSNYVNIYAAMVTIPMTPSPEEVQAADNLRAALDNDTATGQRYRTTPVTPVAEAPAASKPINDELRYNIFRGEISSNGMLSKRADNLPNRYLVRFDPNAMGETSAYYNVQFNNGTRGVITGYSVKDRLADDRMYYKAALFRFWSGDWTKLYRIWGLDASGNRTRIIKEFTPAELAGWQSGANFNVVKIDFEAEQEVKEMVRQVDAGTVAPQDTQPVAKRVEGFEVEFRPDHQFQPGAQYTMRVELGFRDPYHMTNFDDPTFDKVLENTAEYLGTYQSADGTRKPFHVKDSADATFARIPESISFSKRSFQQNITQWSQKFRNEQTGNLGTAVGKEALFRIDLLLDGVSQSRWFRNPKIIEVLPVGLRYHSYVWGDDDSGYVYGYNPFDQAGTGVDPTRVELIDDYKGTGRQAVIFHFPDFKPGQFEFPRARHSGDYLRLMMRTTITSDALPDPRNLNATDKLGNLNTSLNRTYFTADNLYNDLHPGTVNRSGGNNTFHDNRSSSWNTDNSGVAGLIEDEFDVDNDGATNDFVLASRATVTITKERAVEANKEIRSTQSLGYEGWRRTFVRTDYNAEYDYRLNILNTKESSVDKLKIYDILPYVGDSAYQNHPTRLRGSQFRDRLRGAIVNPDPTKYKIYYSTTANPTVDSAAAMTLAAMNWTENLPADPATVTAFKIEMLPGKVLAQNENPLFVVPMLAPQKPAGDLYTTEKGVNYFTVSYDGGTVFQASNAVDNYVVNAIPVEKIWTGGTYRGPITAILKQNGQVYSDTRYPDGKLVLDASNNWKASFIGIPSADVSNTPYVYSVEEEGAGTGDLANFDTRVTGTAVETAGTIPGFKIHNTAKKDLIARVEWIDGADNNADGIADVTGNRDQVRPSSVQVRLERRAAGETNFTPVPHDANNPTHNTALTTISDDGNGVYTHTYSGLSAEDGQGRQYEYRIVEIDNNNLNNYPQTLANGSANRVSSTATDGALLVTNVLQRYPLHVKKLWNDGGNPTLRPQNIEFKVQRKVGSAAAADISIPGVVTQKTLTDVSGVWEASFTDLIKYNADGTEYDYSVVEIAQPALQNFTTTYSPQTIRLGTSALITVTNTFKAYGLSVETEWVDANNAQNVRPADTAVRLVRVDGAGAEVPLPNTAQTKSALNAVVGQPNKWLITYPNLPKYDVNGQPYKYKVVQEDEPGLNNYRTTYPAQLLEAVQNPADSVLKIRNELNLIQKPVQKVWAGDTGNESLRPANVSFKLYRKTASTPEAVVQSGGTDVLVTVDNTGTWRGVFTDLLTYHANGEEYIYSIREQNVGVGNLASYKAPTYSMAADGALVATNALSNSITARIDWYDGVEDADGNGLVDTSSNVDNVRPNTVSVKLQRRLQGSTNFDDVPAIPSNPSHNTAITTITKDPVTGLFTHTYIGMPDKNAAGVPYEYRVVEQESEGLRNYPDRTTTNLDDRSSITDSNGVMVVSNYIQRYPLRTNKVWNDASNPSLRPTNISFKVQRAVGAAVPTDVTVPGVVTQKTLPAPDGSWTATFTDLVRYDANGDEFKYTVVENNTAGMANYNSNVSAAVTLDGNSVITVTNTLVETGLTVEVEWDDQNNVHNVRPSDVVTKLVRSTPGGVEEPVANSERTLSNATPGANANTWKVVYGNLPKFTANGQEYSYRVIQEDENGLRNYTTTYPDPIGPAAQNPANTVLRVKNTLTLITKPVQKRWQDDDDVVHQRPASLEFKLYRQIGTGAKTAVLDSSNQEVRTTATPTSGGGWRAEFTNLLKYDANGAEYVYSVEELGAGVGAMARYKAPVYTMAQDGTLEVTNALNIPVLPVRVDWVDNNDDFAVRPSTTTVQLIRTTPGNPPENVGGPVTISATNQWQHRFRNTPEFDPSGIRYTYSLVEIDHPTLNNYPTTRRDGSPNRVFHLEPAGPNNYNEDTLVITNIIEGIDIPVRKVWADNSNALGARPTEIQIHLQRDGAVYRTQNVSGTSDTWNHTFVNVPKFRADGSAFDYAIVEENASNLRNYNASYSGDITSGLVVTNTMIPTSVVVTKNWVGEIHSNLRPVSLNIGILRNDAATPYRTAIMTTASAQDATTWSYTFHDLVKYAPDGSEYVYTAFEEPDVMYYHGSVSGLTLTNVYVPNPVDVNLQMQKIVHGDHVPASERYVFELKAIGNALMPAPGTNPITISMPMGANTFPSIHYTSVGTHEYEIREIAGTTEGYTYDPSVYKVRVNVTDPDGNLRADISYEKIGAGNTSEALFENTYVRPESDLNIRKSIITSLTIPSVPFQIKVEYNSDEEFTYSGDVSGTLRSGDVIILPAHRSFTIHNMPIGLEYRISEINHDGFTVRYHQGTGKVGRRLTEVVVMNSADGTGRNLIPITGGFIGGGSSGGGGNGGGGKIIGGGGNTETPRIGPGENLNNPLEEGSGISGNNQAMQPSDGSGYGTGDNGRNETDSLDTRGSTSGQLSKGTGRLNQVTNLIRKTDNKLFVGNNTATRGKNGSKAIPKTSDATNVLPFVILTAMGGFGLMVLRKRKKEEE